VTIKSTFIWTSVHTVIKILAGIVINKIIAVYLGPAGLAIIGQFQNFSQLVINIATGSIHTGIVKYTAENKSSKENLFKIWNNALYISLALSFLTIITVILLNGYLSTKVFFSNKYSELILVFASTLIFNVMNMYLLAILNGLQNIKLFTAINILISIVTLIIVSFLTIEYQLTGALYALIITQSLVFFISFLLVYKKYKFDFFVIKSLKNFDYLIVKKLLSFGMVSFVSGVTMSLMLLSVRYIIEADMSLEYAGYWEALWKISTYFTMLTMLPASIYYLPKYAELKAVSDIKEKFLESLKFFAPLQILFGAILFIFKLFIIKLLFTEDFILISPVLIFMIIGDIIRVISYLIVNIMYSKGFMLKLIILDISYNFLLTVLIYFLFKEYSLLGLGYSYLIANVFVLLYVLKFYIKLDHFIENKELNFVEK
jgi:O-antigen/teichoic acid export membrane protein